MTIGEQSVSAMMPNLMAVVSGASLAYTPPAQPCGTPANSVAAELVPAVAASLMNARLVDLFISLLRQEDVGDHHERAAVGRAGRRLLEKRAGEQVGIARRQRQLGKERPRHLHVDLVPDARAVG